MKQLANEFNIFFTNVVPSLVENFQPDSPNYTENLMSFNNAISDFDLTIEEFETAFKSLKHNKAAVIDTTNLNIFLDSYDEIKYI